MNGTKRFYRNSGSLSVSPLEKKSFKALCEFKLYLYGAISTSSVIKMTK